MVYHFSIYDFELDMDECTNLEFALSNLSLWCTEPTAVGFSRCVLDTLIKSQNGLFELLNFFTLLRHISHSFISQCEHSKSSKKTVGLCETALLVRSISREDDNQQYHKNILKKPHGQIYLLLEAEKICIIIIVITTTSTTQLIGCGN